MYIMQQIPVYKISKMNEKNYLSVVRNIGPIAIGSDITVTAIAVLSVAGRFYSRASTLKTLYYDDWIILLALVLNIAKTFSMATLIMTAGYGKHGYNVSPEEILAANRPVNEFASQYLTYIGWAIAFSLVRSSTLAFLARINPYIRIRNAIWAGLVLNNVHLAIWLCSTIFRWSDMKWSFTSEPPLLGITYTCLNGLVWNLALNITAMILDVYCWCLPAFLGCHLRVSCSIKMRLQVLALMCTGLVVVFGGIARAWLMFGLLDPTVDIRWSWMEIQITSTLELNFGIIAACLPGNKLLFGCAKTLIKKDNILHEFPQADQHPDDDEYVNMRHSNVQEYLSPSNGALQGLEG